VKQLDLHLRKDRRGGKRKGAGRKPNGPRAGVSHLQRERFDRTLPVHVTVRMASHVYNLRSRRCFSRLARALGAAAERFGVRVVLFSVLGNHVHLVVEASSNESLSTAMKGFSVRVARGLNRVMNRRGRVMGDRYHARVLRTPTETRRAIRYVRTNAAHHGLVSAHARDGFTSPVAEVALPTPTTWLVTEGWRRAPS
jgi:REP element-mobilizing transposase RayT